VKKDKSLDEKRLHKELEIIKHELEDLKIKLDHSKKTDLSKLPVETVTEVYESTSEVVKSATDIVDKAEKVVRSAAQGAYVGAKKSPKEEDEHA